MRTLVSRPLLSALVASALLPGQSLAQPAPGGDAVSLDALVVTASRHAVPVVDAPAALSVVTRRDIETRGADNVLAALRGEVGVTLQGRSIGGRQVISLRGLDSKHTLFLVDGRRVGASDGVIGHSDFQYDWVAVEDIERIEIVRGPLSVLYGSEALGGVVNIITRQPGDAWRYGATVEGSRAAGSRGGDGSRMAARLDGPLGNDFYFRAGAGFSQIDPLASRTDPRISELEGRDKRDAWASVQWRGKDGNRVEVEQRVGREERQADARERSGQRRYHVTYNDIDRRFTSASWDAPWRIAGWADPLTTQVRAYEAGVDVVNRRTEGVTVNPTQRVEERVLEGQGRLPFGRQALLAGFEARNEAFEDPGMPGGRSIAQQRALFAQDEVTLSDKLQLNAGLRYDHHALYGSEWSPRAYLVWKPAPDWVAKGGYNHGFKAPNLKQIVPGGRAEGPNVFLGNPDLKPETSDGIEAGFGWQRGGIEAQVMAFEQRVKELIEIRLVRAGTVPGTGTYTYENLSEARFRGLEAGASAPLAAGFSARASFTLLDATNGSGQQLDKRPKRTGSARLDWQEGPWRASVYADYTGPQLLPSATTGAPSVWAPGYTMVGAQVTRSLPYGLEASLGVSNLTDVYLFEKSALFPQAEMPRTWRLALRGRW